MLVNEGSQKFLQGMQSWQKMEIFPISLFDFEMRQPWIFSTFLMFGLGNSRKIRLFAENDWQRSRENTAACALVCCINLHLMKFLEGARELSFISKLGKI